MSILIKCKFIISPKTILYLCPKVENSIKKMRKIILLLTLIYICISCSNSKIKPDYVFLTQGDKNKYIKSYNETLKLWQTPYEEADVLTSFGTAHVIISGPKNGQTLVLFHGTDASSTMWYPNIHEFSKNYRVYAIDFPLEAGKSQANRVKFNNKESAKFYSQVFEHFKMKNINLLGISRGGWMATYLALQPELEINKLVLLSPAQTFGGIKNFGKVMSGLNLKAFPTQKSLNKFFNAFSYKPTEVDSSFKQQLFLAYKLGNSKPRMLAMIPFSKKELQSLKMPVFVLIGDHDIVNGEKSLVKAHKYLPNVQTEVITDAGHFLSIDQSAIVNEKVNAFLEDTKPLGEITSTSNL